jgi:hypothetical protein
MENLIPKYNDIVWGNNGQYINMKIWIYSLIRTHYWHIVSKLTSKW